ncbi:MAG: dihydropteroate synthase [Sumerlaeia bacterium]
MADGETRLGPLVLKPGDGPRIMAIINASPESFFAGSVAAGRDAVRAAASLATEAGADILDIGAMSTAPYKETHVSPAEEEERMAEAVAAAREATDLPISADTQRANVARAAIEAGACIVNDVMGFAGDEDMAAVVDETGAGCVLMANENALANPEAEDPRDVLELCEALLREALARAEESGIPRERIVLDPGVGFFRRRAEVWARTHEPPLGRPKGFFSRGYPYWAQYDLALLRGVGELGRRMGYPMLVSASRKSMFKALLGQQDPADRLAGSLAVAAWCAAQGVAIVRTHDVAETCDVVRMWRLLGNGA